MPIRLATVENGGLGEWDMELESEADKSETKPMEEDQAALFPFHATNRVEISLSVIESGHIDLIHVSTNGKLVSGLHVDLEQTSGEPSCTALSRDLLSQFVVGYLGISNGMSELLSCSNFEFSTMPPPPADTSLSHHSCDAPSAWET